MVELIILLNKADNEAKFLAAKKSRSSSDEEFYDEEVWTGAVRIIAFHAAGVALAVCGKSAETVLENVENIKSLEEQQRLCVKIRGILTNLQIIRANF